MPKGAKIQNSYIFSDAVADNFSAKHDVNFRAIGSLISTPPRSGKNSLAKRQTSEASRAANQRSTASDLTTKYTQSVSKHSLRHHHLALPPCATNPQPFPHSELHPRHYNNYTPSCIVLPHSPVRLTFGTNA